MPRAPTEGAARGLSTRRSAAAGPVVAASRSERWRGALGHRHLFRASASAAAADATLKRATEEAAVPVVNVVSPIRARRPRRSCCPGTTQAFTDAPIYARTNGYLKRWYFDIGAHVKQGQLLAEIETPEIDQQLEQARADLETAQANLRLAKITADRWQVLLKTDSVSKQETDQAVSNSSATKATVDSNAANVRRLEQLQGFEKIYAPFDGVITARNTDIGVLDRRGRRTPAAGSSFTWRPSTRCASSWRSRRSIPGPPGPAPTPRSRSTSSPGGSFHGTLVRNANAIDLGLAHPAGRGGRRQSQRRAPARRLRVRPSQAAEAGPVRRRFPPIRCSSAPRGLQVARRARRPGAARARDDRA